MPIVGPDMAAYVIGRHAYAFSPRLKSWDVVRLAAGHAEYPSIGPGYATCRPPATFTLSVIRQGSGMTSTLRKDSALKTSEVSEGPDGRRSGTSQCKLCCIVET